MPISSFATPEVELNRHQRQAALIELPVQTVAPYSLYARSRRLQCPRTPARRPTVTSGSVGIVFSQRSRHPVRATELVGAALPPTR